MIQAIETKYKGYRFRSRLEARWAVFFDALRVPWEYEPESYLLPSGPYLPDFVVGKKRVFFEVKHAGWMGNVSRHNELVEATGRPCFIVTGNPGVCDGGDHDGSESSLCGCNGWQTPDSMWHDDNGEFLIVGNPGFAYGRREPSLWVIPDVGEGIWQKKWCVQIHEDYFSHEREPIPFSEELISATKAARSARFEYGESGT